MGQLFSGALLVLYRPELVSWSLQTTEKLELQSSYLPTKRVNYHMGLTVNYYRGKLPWSRRVVGKRETKRESSFFLSAGLHLVLHS